MAGIKGRSGRKCIRDEEKRLRVIDKAWAITEEFLSDPNISLKDKAEMASKIIVKDIPTELTGDALKHNVIIQIIEPIADSANPNSRVSGYGASLAEGSQKG